MLDFNYNCISLYGIPMKGECNFMSDFENNKTKIDKNAIEKHIYGILLALGENPEREGLKETPKRVANMFSEVFDGINYTNEDIATMFDKTFEDDIGYGKENIVVIKDIETFSFCEHHMALMYDININIAYIPKGKVIGISKIARISDMVCKRLQLQERIGSDIADILMKITGSEDVGIIIKASHSCMTARGIKKSTATTKTLTLCGKFENPAFLKYLED